MASMTLPLSDAEYWTNPRKDQEKLAFELLRKAPVGFTLGAPGEVELDQRQTLPVVGYYKGSIADDRALRLERTTVLVAVRLESNEVYVDRAFDLRDRPPVEHKGPPPKGNKTAFFSLDARRLRGLPWRDGTLRLALLSYDQLSEVREVRLVSEVGRDPAVRAWAESQRGPTYPAPVQPPLGRSVLPSYVKDPQSPAPPEAPGIALVHERVGVLASDKLYVVRGSFALPVTERDLVKPRPQVTPAPGQTEDEAVAATGWREVGVKTAAAVVPLTLVVAASNHAEAWVVSLRVPVRGSLTAGATATGNFAIDLRALCHNLGVGRYCLYAFSDRAVAGPSPFALVTPEQAKEL